MKAFTAATVLAVCAIQFPLAAAAEDQHVICNLPRSGYVEAGKTLNGPFLVTSLETLVNPATPKGGYIVFKNVWFSVEQFKGPFFLDAGSGLRASADYLPLGFAFSGYDCVPDNKSP